MRIINTNASNEDSFKYSILCSLHYFDILRNPQKLSKLMSFENIYNFTHNTPKEFEIDNPNISLTVFNEDEKIIYSPNNNTLNKAHKAKINDDRYAAIKPIKDHFIKLKELLQSFSQSELRDPRVQNIFKRYGEYHWYY